MAIEELVNHPVALSCVVGMLNLKSPSYLEETALKGTDDPIQSTNDNSSAIIRKIASTNGI